MPQVLFAKALQKSPATHTTLLLQKRREVCSPFQVRSDRLDKAQSEWDASHAKAKIGPVTATSSGGHVDNKDRREGQWKETVGSAKESAGTLLGSKDLQQEGRDQAQEGQAQSAVGELSDWIQGASDRLRGRYIIPGP